MAEPRDHRRRGRGNWSGKSSTPRSTAAPGRDPSPLPQRRTDPGHPPPRHAAGPASLPGPGRDRGRHRRRPWRLATEGRHRADAADAGYAITDCGTHSPDPVDYPDVAHAVAMLVAAGVCPNGIVIDGAGIGSCMVANKVPGVRAALCYDISSARNSREHNHANVLTLGARLIGEGLGHRDRRDMAHARRGARDVTPRAWRRSPTSSSATSSQGRQQDDRHARTSSSTSWRRSPGRCSPPSDAARGRGNAADLRGVRPRLRRPVRHEVRDIVAGGASRLSSRGDAATSPATSPASSTTRC